MGGSIKSSLGAIKLRNPKDNYHHNMGKVRYECSTPIPCVFTAQSSGQDFDYDPDDVVGVQQEKFLAGEGMQIRFRLDSLKEPHQIHSHPAPTDAKHDLVYMNAPTTRSMATLNSQVIGGDLYSSEYFRYLVEKVMYKFKITNYETFPIMISATVGATVCKTDVDQNFAAHKAANSLEFGANYGMATSRYLFEATDYSLDADGVVTSTNVRVFPEYMQHLNGTKTMIVPAHPDASETFALQGATDNLQMRSKSKAMTISMNNLDLFRKVANGAVLDQKQSSFSLHQHGGTVLSTADGDGSYFTHPGPSSATTPGTAGTNLSPGGIWLTLTVQPVNPGQRLTTFDMNDTNSSMQLCTGRVFCEVESKHDVILYDRIVNLPVENIPTDVQRVAAYQEEQYTAAANLTAAQVT